MAYRKNLPPVYVMNVSCIGLGIMRDLGEKDIPIIALSSKLTDLGYFSRYCKTKVCPSLKKEPERLVTYLVNEGKKLSTRAVIFPSSDNDVLFLSKYRTELERYYIIPLPKEKILLSIMDKWELYNHAKECNIPAPMTYLIEDENSLVERSREVGFPCIIKPVYSYLWHEGSAWETVGRRKVIRVNSLKELQHEYRKIQSVTRKVLLQEFVPGEDDQLYTFASYFNGNSEPVASFTARKILQYPDECGTGCVVKSEKVPETEKIGCILLKHIKYSGISEVEFKRDSATGEFKLLEINPRHWDWHSLGTISGVNLSHIAYKDIIGLSRTTTNSQLTEYTWINEEKLLVAIAKSMIKKPRIKLYELYKKIKGRKTWAVFSIKDPFPFIFWCFRFVYLIIERFVKSLLAKFSSIPL